MKTAEFKGMKFDYEEEHLNEHELTEISHDDAKQLLLWVKTVFDELGIDFYLAYGTLLGAVREKDFIEGDLDVDVYCRNEEIVFKSLQYLKEKNLILIRYIKNKLFSFRYTEVPGAYIDVYVYRTPMTLWGIYCNTISRKYVPKKLLKGTKKIDFLGEEFNCVENPVALLRFWYGDTWNIPIGKFEKNYKYDVASHYYYAKIEKAITRNIKRCIRKIVGNRIYDIIKSWKNA